MKKLFFIMLSIIGFSFHAEGGVSLNATRVIVTEQDVAKAVKINNSDKEQVFLVRSWVSNIDSQGERDEWIVTPPVYKLNNEDAIQIKLSLLSNDSLPKDRESVFYLNVLTIPSTKNNTSVSSEGPSGQVNIAINTRVKVFYRPASIASVDMNKLLDEINVKKEGRKVIVFNPTPYHLNFQKIIVNNKEYKIDKQMVAPFSSVEIETPDEPKVVAYQIINDFGGVTKLKSTEL